MKKWLCVLSFSSFMFFSTNNFADTLYTVEKTANDEIFIINGQVFKAKTFCFGVNDGDKVLFTEGNANGVCISATFVDTNTNTTCRVWCP